MDFTSQAYLRDPAPELMKLRGAGPVVEVRFPILGRVWIPTTSDLAARVLKDSETFTMRKNGAVAGLRWWMPAWVRALAVSMLSMDEPDHARLRSIVDEAFHRRAVLDMEPRILAIAESLRLNFSLTEVRPTWPSAMRASCPCQSSVSFSAGFVTRT